MGRDEYEEAKMFCESIESYLPPDCQLPTYSEMERGGIIGETEIIDCVTESKSPWFCGRYGFVLRNSKPLPFEPCKGALGFFRPTLPPV